MKSVRIQTGDKEPVAVLLVGVGGHPLTGLTNVKLRVRRTSDDFYFDWSDNTFKTLGSVVTLLQTLVEVNATGSPGYYHLSTASHVLGFDTSLIANPTDDDNYVLTSVQDGTPQSAANLPQAGEIKVGHWQDYIDQYVSDNATPTEVRDELRNFGLDHLVAVNPGVVPPAAGTYLRQILDNLERKPEYVVLQTYSYNQTADVLEAVIWIEHMSLVYTLATSCSVSWYDKDGALQFTMTDATPDAQGFFKVSQAAPGLSSDTVYYAVAQVVTPAGTFSGGKGNFTF